MQISSMQSLTSFTWNVFKTSLRGFRGVLCGGRGGGHSDSGEGEGIGIDVHAVQGGPARLSQRGSRVVSIKLPPPMV